MFLAWAQLPSLQVAQDAPRFLEKQDRRQQGEGQKVRKGIGEGAMVRGNGLGMCDPQSDTGRCREANQFS